MITLFYEKSNTILKKTIQNYLNTVNFGVLECPNCHSNDIIKWGYYERGVLFFSNTEQYAVEYDYIKVQRVRCKSCGKTHALLPIGIIPYKQLSSEVVISIITKIASTNMEKAFSMFNFISEYTIKKLWLDFKKKHFPLLSTLTKTRNVLKALSSLKENINTQLAYIHNYKRAFMQIKLVCVNVTYVRVPSPT